MLWLWRKFSQRSFTYLLTSCHEDVQLCGVCLLYRCRGLILLETYTSNRAENFELPPFLDVQREVTGDLDYSMHNLSKKLDLPLWIPSTLHDSPTKDKPDAPDVDHTAASVPVTEVDGDANSILSTSVRDRSTDEPEVLAKEPAASELNPKDEMSDAENDSTEVQRPEMVVKPMMLSDPNSRVVVDSVPGSIKNGYHCGTGKDKVASLTLSKLDTAHSNAALNGTLSENGHIVFGEFDDYERFIKLCLSGKSGSPAVKWVASKRPVRLFWSGCGCGVFLW